MLVVEDEPVFRAAEVDLLTEAGLAVPPAGAAGVALAPLDRMTTLAGHIADGARSRRLRPTRPDTDLGRTPAAFDDKLDALEAAEAHAHSAESRMSRFLADASQDLRTPLAGVIAVTFEAGATGSARGPGPCSPASPYPARLTDFRGEEALAAARRSRR